MELRKLQYFLVIAEEGSITRAAERLHISQPTLSRQIHELEEELKTRLLVRHSRSVSLTEGGILLRARAQDIMEMVSKTVSEFENLETHISGDVHIGCAESEQMRYIGSCMQEVLDEHPDIRFHLYSGDTSDLSLRLERGLLDFAVLADTPDMRRYNALQLPGADRWGLIMRSDAPLAAKTAVTAEDLRGLPIMVSRQGLRNDIPRLFGEQADSLHVIVTLNLTYNGTVLAREGLGYVLSFDKLADTGPGSGLCFRPLSPPLETLLFVVWRRHQHLTPASQVFLGKMQDHFLPPD